MRHNGGVRLASPLTLTYRRLMAKQLEFSSFAEFYPFYLSQHSKPATRAFHAVGTGLATLNLAKSLAVGPRKQALLTPVIGYGFAWFSHFVIEGNKPATFGYPLYSFRGDFTMMLDMLRGRNADLQEIADEYLVVMKAEESAVEAATSDQLPQETPTPSPDPQPGSGRAEAAPDAAPKSIPEPAPEPEVEAIAEQAPEATVAPTSNTAASAGADSEPASASNQDAPIS